MKTRILDGQAIPERARLFCLSRMLVTQRAKDSTGWENTLATMEKWGMPLSPAEHNMPRGPRAVRAESASLPRHESRAPSDERGDGRRDRRPARSPAQRFAGCSPAFRGHADRLHAHPLGFVHPGDPGHGALPRRLLALA